MSFPGNLRLHVVSSFGDMKPISISALLDSPTSTYYELFEQFSSGLKEEQSDFSLAVRVKTLVK